MQNITLGINQNFDWANHYKQHWAEGFKRLILNDINYYNFSLHSGKVKACANKVAGKEWLALIALTLTDTW